MIKILIIEDNLHYSKKVLNNILSKFKNVQLMFMATTCKEGIDIINNNHIDLIFLDLKLPDGNGFKIIENLKVMNIIHKPKIILISGDICMINEAIKKYNAYETIDKLNTMEEIYNKIKKMINDINYENNKGEIKKYICSEIFKLGYNIKYKGTQYIIEAILYVYEQNNYDLLDNLEKNVYSYISKRHKKSVNNIKTNIIKATKKIYNKNLLYDLTPKSSIISVLTKTRQEFSYMY